MMRAEASSSPGGAVGRGTKKDLAYDYLKRRIQDRSYLPGHRVTASEVAAAIGTSVLPVREALLMLEAERLVTMTPYVGAVVAWVSPRDVLSIVQVLSILEGYATRLAHPRSADFIDQLTDLNERLLVAVRSEMWEWFIELNRTFHFTIFDHAQNVPLRDAIRVSWGQLDTLFAASAFHMHPSRTAGDLADHEELIRMLAAPETDALALELAARRHRGRTATYLEERMSIEDALGRD
jgi:DNA-binding GntR family transcriptional regulator